MTGGSAPVWGDPGIPLPPLPDPLPGADLYVIGLGAAGMAAVRTGCERDLRVVGIDASGVAAGASGRNGGFLLAGRADAYHRTNEAIGRDAARALYQLTLAEIDRMAAETPDAIRRVGSWRVAASAEEAADLIDHFSALRLGGFDAEREDTPWGPGLRLPYDAAFDPAARAASVARAAVSRGASLFVGVIDDVLSLPGPTIVAVDGGLEVVLPGLASRVRTARLQMVATAPTNEIDIQRPVYRRFGFDYWQQRTDGRVVAGGLRDQFVEDEWSCDATPTPPVQDALEHLLREVVGVKDAPITHRWAGCSAFTTDTRPVCELIRDGAVAIGGYGGTGNVIGPLCGRAAVQLLFDGTSAIADTLLA